MSGESEEWCFDVRTKEVGKRQPYLIDELISKILQSSSTCDATTARWHAAFETRVAASKPTFRGAAQRMEEQLRHSEPVGQSVCAPQKQSLDLSDLELEVSTRRPKEKFTATLVPSEDAWTVAVSPGTQETPVMPEAASLTASKISSAGK